MNKFSVGCIVLLLTACDRGPGFGEMATVAPSKAANPTVAVDARSGAVYVAWVQTEADSSTSAYVVRRERDGRIGSPIRLNDRPGYVTLATENPAQVLTGPDGTVYVGSASRRAVPENRVDFRVARSTDGGRSFTGAVILDSTACICCRTAIATGPDGSAHALWRHVFPGNVRDFVSARTSDGAATFSAPARVHEDHWVLNGCPDIGPDIAIDARNTIHAAWYTGAPGRQGLWYAASRDGGQSFATPVPLLTDKNVPPSEVKLAALGNAAWAVWEDRREKGGEIRVAGVGSANSIRLGAGRYPTVAAAGDVLAVAWSEGGAIRLRTAAVEAADAGKHSDR